MDNGNGGPGPAKADHITLDYDVATDNLHIGGACSSIHRMRELLLRAVWVVEGQLRAQDVQKVLTQRQAAQETRTILDKLHLRG